MYEFITRGTIDFSRLIAACESLGPYCLIGELVVNCYVEPVYTLDADIVVIASILARLVTRLHEEGFGTAEYAHSVNRRAPSSDLRIQLSTDERYQAFLARLRVQVACLDDVVQGEHPAALGEQLDHGSDYSGRISGIGYGYSPRKTRVNSATTSS